MRIALIVAAGLISITLLAGYLVLAAALRGGVAGVGTAVGAQIGCADVFLMHRTVGEAERDDVHALAPAAQIIHLRVDQARRTVTATIPAILSRTSVFRPGVGCTLSNAGPPPAPVTPPAPSSNTGPFSFVEDPSKPSSALSTAVDRVFQETNIGGRIDTRAILVVRHGALLSERYAPGFSVSTPFLGWSATKSLTSALVGVLVRDGRLTLDAPAPVREWRAPGDPRAAITLRQLLTMSSGLKFIEDYVPGSDSSQMLFHERDMAAYAARQPLKHPPGAYWSYSSGTANIVSRIVQQTVGASAADYDRFAHDALFGPLGMNSALIEPDEAGVPVGSSYGYATARDWARFGLLYLNRGQAGGRRILPESWIDFTRSPTPSAPRRNYGAMFWLNQGPASGPGARDYPHCPTDMYLADGHNGQFVAIIPSKDTVIVRLGWTPEGQEFNVDRHLCGILAALGP